MADHKSSVPIAAASASSASRDVKSAVDSSDSPKQHRGGGGRAPPPRNAPAPALVVAPTDDPKAYQYDGRAGGKADGRACLPALDRHASLVVLSFLAPGELSRCTSVAKAWHLPYHNVLWRAHCLADRIPINAPATTTTATAIASTTAKSAVANVPAAAAASTAAVAATTAPAATAPASASAAAPAATATATATAAAAAAGGDEPRRYYRIYSAAATNHVFLIPFDDERQRYMEVYRDSYGATEFHMCRVVTPNSAAVGRGHHHIACLLSLLFESTHVIPHPHQRVTIGLHGTRFPPRTERLSTLCAAIMACYRDAERKRGEWSARSPVSTKNRRYRPPAHPESVKRARGELDDQSFSQWAVDLLVARLWDKKNWPDPKIPPPKLDEPTRIRITQTNEPHFSVIGNSRPTAWADCFAVAPVTTADTKKQQTESTTSTQTQTGNSNTASTASTTTTPAAAAAASRDSKTAPAPAAAAAIAPPKRKAPRNPQQRRNYDILTRLDAAASDPAQTPVFAGFVFLTRMIGLTVPLTPTVAPADPSTTFAAGSTTYHVHQYLSENALDTDQEDSMDLRPIAAVADAMKANQPFKSPGRNQLLAMPPAGADPLIGSAYSYSNDERDKRDAVSAPFFDRFERLLFGGSPADTKHDIAADCIPMDWSPPTAARDWCPTYFNAGGRWTRSPGCTTLYRPSLRAIIVCRHPYHWEM